HDSKEALALQKVQRTSIGGIPEEILVIIFELSLPKTPLYRPSAICRLRQTCRWWAKIIFQTPSFWSSISSVQGVEWIRLAVQRSATCLFDADINGISKSSAIRAIAQQLPRTTSLSIALPLRNDVRNPPNQFTDLHQPAPQALQELTISMVGSDNITQSWLPFNGTWTELRSLTIRGANLDWEACQLSRLERLSIGGEFYNLSLSVLLQIFRTCQDLQDCRISNWEGEVGSDSRDPTEVVTLPKLTTLVVHSSLSLYIDLLRKINSPNCQYFKFREVFQSAGQAWAVDTLLDVLTAKVKRHGVRHGKTTALYLPTTQLIILRFQLASLAPAGQAVQMNIHVTLRRKAGLTAFKRSRFWSILEGDGAIITKASSLEVE
ncbi:hypothetical protein FRB90_004210, partial [Tulasnella sp. 427]